MLHKDNSPSSFSAADIPVFFYESDFAAPDKQLELIYETELEKLLSTIPDRQFVVSS